jgi:hypothetical protein
MVALVLVSVVSAAAMVAVLLWVWTTRQKGNL